MGTDIHGVFQRRTPEGGWQDVETLYDFNRRYLLFSVLAGVRNGVGFAGIKTGEPVVPIAEPRGVPGDFVCSEGWKQHGCERDECYCLGEHSFSWLTSAEMLAWYANAPAASRTGVITREQYSTAERTSPKSYCGDVCGKDIVVVEEAEVPNTDKEWTHVRVTWNVEMTESLAFFFDEVQRLQDEHGEVRFVFGFDS